MGSSLEAQVIQDPGNVSLPENTTLRMILKGTTHWDNKQQSSDGDGTC
jgi:hypothetical protein